MTAVVRNPAKPREMRRFLRRFIRWAKRNEGSLKAIGAILAVAVSAFEYHNRKEDGRVQESLKYVERYQKQPVFDARKALDMYWLHRDQRQTLRTTPPGLWKDLALNAAEKHEHGQHIYVMHAFYRDLAICYSKEVCDRDTLCTFFARDMDAFRNMNVKVLADWGEAWRDSFTRDINAMLDGCRKKDPSLIKA